MGPEVIVPVGFFAMIVAIVALPTYLKGREQKEMQQTLRQAIDKGQPLPPELIAAVSRRVERGAPSAARDLRMGVILLAVGLGIAVFGYMIGWEEQDAVYPLIGSATIPAFVGIALIVLSFFNKNKG